MEESKPAIKSRTFIGSALGVITTIIAASRIDLLPDSDYDEIALVVVFVASVGIALWGRGRLGNLDWLRSTTVRSIVVRILVFAAAKFKVSLGDAAADQLLLQFAAVAAYGGEVIGRMKQGGISGVLRADKADPLQAPLKEALRP